MKSLSRMTFSLTVLAFGFIAAPAIPADLFLKIDGFPGTSAGRDTQGAIEVESFSASVSSTAPESGSLARSKSAGRAQFSPLTFAKIVDQNSPRFALAAADGRRLPTVTFEARVNTGRGETAKFYEIILTNVSVTSYTVSAHGGDQSPPTEEIALTYESIEWKFFPQSTDGRTETRETTASFDIGKGTGSESNGASGGGSSSSGGRSSRR